MSPVFIKYLVYLFHKLKYLHLWQSKGSGFHLWFYLKGNSAHCLVFQKPHKRVRYILQNKQQSSSDASVSGNINRVNRGQTGKGVSEMPHRNIYCLRLDLFCSMLDVVWSVWSLVTVMQKSCVWSPLWSRVCSPYVAPHTSQLRIFVTLAPAVTLCYIAYFTRPGGLAWLGMC